MASRKLSEHFTVYEARCRCGCKIEDEYIPQLTTLAERHEAFRASLNSDPKLAVLRNLAGCEFRLIPVSWLRCPIHNKNEGGAKDSRHLIIHADGTDLTCPELPTEILYQKAQKHYNRVIWYRGRHFIHVDQKPDSPKYWIKEPSKTLEPQTEIT